tara:strand:- start:38 stop:1180 length:1143 start_codon:yes stop_codon:yes gene_type:complete
VAGTNGKGSSVAILESLFMNQGISVGSYTSPHLHKYNERIKINSKPVSDGKIVRAFEKIESIRSEELLTYFEFGTLAAFEIFSNADIEVLILEVGLGGRLDAVNIIDPDGSIITNIGLDHMDWLGDSKEKIGREKAGVMRKNIPTVFGDTDVPKSVIHEAKVLDAKLIRLNTDYTYREISDQSWVWSDSGKKEIEIESPNINGSHQIKNAAAILALLSKLDDTVFPTLKSINKSLRSININGRLDFRLHEEINWLFDVSHNTESISELFRFITKLQYRKCIVVLGIMSDKDALSMISLLTDITDQWFIPELEIKRAIQADEIKSLINQKSDKLCQVSNSVDLSLRNAKSISKPNDLIVVAGSFYLVSPALEWFSRKTKDN